MEKFSYLLENAEKGERALPAFEAYLSAHGDEEDKVTTIGDLIADLMHLADTLDEGSGDAAVALAQFHYDAEKADEE